MGVVLSGCVIITSENTTHVDQRMLGVVPKAVMDASLVL